MSSRFTVTYHVRSAAADIEARAQGIAVEQSVEMPLNAIDDETVLSEIVGSVEGIDDLGAASSRQREANESAEPTNDRHGPDRHGPARPGHHQRQDAATGTPHPPDLDNQGRSLFAVRIGLATATVGTDAGQFLNMVFGNTSLHDDVTLRDIEIPETLVHAFAGPHHGIAALRFRLRLHGRAMTGSALKPQGLPADALATLAEKLAAGGLDFIKDDHGLADQRYSHFADRVAACAAGVARGVRATGHPTRYVPSLTGNLDQLRAQATMARDAGLDCVMLAPMICGFPSMQALVREFPDMAFFAHPSLGGASRIAPDLLIGKLFRLLGADAVIFPSYGGRFGYSPETCRRLAGNARRSDDGMKAALPVPAGGMTLERTSEILDFYGEDTMILIGGSLLLARERITEETERFTRAVAGHVLR